MSKRKPPLRKRFSAPAPVSTAAVVACVPRAVESEDTDIKADEKEAPPGTVARVAPPGAAVARVAPPAVELTPPPPPVPAPPRCGTHAVSAAWVAAVLPAFGVDLASAARVPRGELADVFTGNVVRVETGPHGEDVVMQPPGNDVWLPVGCAAVTHGASEAVVTLLSNYDDGTCLPFVRGEVLRFVPPVHEDDDSSGSGGPPDVHAQAYRVSVARKGGDLFPRGAKAATAAGKDWQVWEHDPFERWARARARPHVLKPSHTYAHTLSVLGHSAHGQRVVTVPLHRPYAGASCAQVHVLRLGCTPSVRDVWSSVQVRRTDVKEAPRTYVPRARTHRKRKTMPDCFAYMKTDPNRYAELVAAFAKVQEQHVPW